ncbi:MAG: PIN domain-containing protein [Chloroflexota bacterium]
MIVLMDASAVVDLSIRSDAGESVRRFLASRADVALVTVAHLDAEVMSAFARLNRADVLTGAEVATLLHRLGSLAMRRLPITSDLLAAAWELRDTVAARDALYVAAAQGMQAKVVTTDDCLARAVPDLVADLG